MLNKTHLVLIAAVTAAAISTAASAAPYVDIRVGPPPPRVEVVPASRPGYVWAPGYWDWRGHRHVWVNGSWVRARRGESASGRRRAPRSAAHRCSRGGWARGDRDRDGVPNYADRRPDDPRRH